MPHRPSHSRYFPEPWEAAAEEKPHASLFDIWVCSCPWQTRGMWSQFGTYVCGTTFGCQYDVRQGTAVGAPSNPFRYATCYAIRYGPGPRAVSQTSTSNFGFPEPIHVQCLANAASPRTLLQQSLRRAASRDHVASFH
jgi:hypothetical protein